MLIKETTSEKFPLGVELTYCVLLRTQIYRETSPRSSNPLHPDQNRKSTAVVFLTNSTKPIFPILHSFYKF